MTPSFLRTKRRNTKQHPLTRSLRAVTSRRKKQRVAATADHAGFDDYHEDSGPRIARVLVIIFLIHIVAIALIYIHQVHLKNSLPGTAKSESAPATEAATTPRFSSGEQPYIVETGDNYTRIAAAHNVDEAELRRVNDNSEIRPGLLLKIPPRRITATEPAEVTALRNPTTTSAATPQTTNPATDGLIAANDPAHRPPGTATEPTIPRATPAGTRNHTVQAGETIWRISQKYSVDQDAIMKLNNITDPRRIQVGQTLKIP